jgi:hypothetical protein
LPFFLVFSCLVLDCCLLDILWGFAETMDIRLPGTFGFVLDRARPLTESVEAAISVKPLATIETGGCSRLLLRGYMLPVRGSGSAISVLDNNGGVPEDAL